MTTEVGKELIVSGCPDCLDPAGCTCGKHLNGAEYLENELPSISGALVLEDDECIVSLGEDGTGFIIARSNDIAFKDVLLEDTAEECNFNHDWDDNLLVGVYKLKITPWADGEDEGGIDVQKVTPLWTVPDPTTPDHKIFENGWLDEKREVARHSSIVYSSSETMVMLLLIRKAGLWQVVDSEPHRSKMLQVWYEDAWWNFCRTDLYEHVATLYTEGTAHPDFWKDPIGHIVRKWSYGLRVDAESHTLYLVDSQSDG